MRGKSLPYLALCLLVAFINRIDSANVPVKVIEAKNVTKPLYNVVASGKISPNSVYYVTVHISRALKDTEIVAEIKGRLEPSNETVSLKETKIVPTNTTQIIAIKTDDLKAGDYKLNVTGKGGAEFTHETSLSLDLNNVLVFVQTDKAMYKPSQLVRYRLLVVNQNLIPLSNVNVTILIKDTNGNIISKIDELSPENGILSHELKLSDQPPLGDWIIDITADKQKFSKGFTIAEYVLPTFDVKIDLPAFTTINASTFPATVKAAYTYGKPVKGDLIFSVSDSHYSYWVHNYQKRKLVQFLTEINGEITIQVDVKDFVDKSNFYNSKTFNFDASVKDKLTGKVYNGTKSLTVHDSNYKFELLKSSRKFIEGLPYTAYIKVSHPDNTPVKNGGPPLKIVYSFGYREHNEKKREVSGVPVNGVVKLTIDTSPFPKKPKIITTVVNGINKTVFASEDEDTSSIKLNAEYDGAKTTVGYVYKASTSDNCYTQLQLAEEQLDKDFKVGDKLEVELIGQKPINEYVYYIITKKGVVKNEVVKVPTNKDASPIQKVKLDVPLDIDSAPRVRILVHRYCNGSIKTDSLEFDVTGVLRTPVAIESNVNETKPGQPVELTVSTKPGSNVGLLGMDQRMILLKSGNDVEKNEIEDGVKRYLGCKGRRDFDSCSPQRHLYHAYGYDPTPWEFRRSGLFMFSNENENRIYYDRVVPQMEAVQVARPLASPGMAGPLPTTVSFDANRGGSVGKIRPAIEAIKVRSFFPETWIWALVDADNSGKATFTSDVPDTITSFVVSAFALNKKTGLGISDNKANVKVFRPFFIKLNLPYSVIRGETVAIPVTVYNYMKTPQSTKVILDNTNKEFDFVEASEDNDVLNDESLKEKNIDIGPNDGLTLTFLIKPKKVGYIEIKLSAIAIEAGDAITEKLLVKPEGKTYDKNKAQLITLDDKNGKLEKSVQIEIPEEIVADSERISVSAIGDVLGPAINNLDDLLRLPYGCGEQNMVRLVPNVAVLDYLTKAKRLTDKVKTKAVANIETGYQRQLTYKHDDGSFSAFGREDNKGSTWLTAFVVKSFIQAKPYATIDDKIINESLAFLLNQQQPDGSFVERGRVLSSYMQGKSGGKNVPLTAYVLIAILAAPHAKTVYAKNVTKAEEYLVNQLEETTDIYEVAIITYALHLHDSKEKDNAYKKLNSLTIKTLDFTYLKSNTTNRYNSDYATVEMTSYALMTLTLKGNTEEALPMVKYLISKQNSNGGFSSTQDTVIGIQALSGFASKVSEKDPNLKIKITPNVGDEKTVDINKDNAIVLQQVLLSPKTKSVKVEAEGIGSAIVQVSSQYNQLKEAIKPAFEIKTELEKVENDNLLALKVCAKFNEGNESGMAVMEVNLPSGYVADLEELHQIKKSDVKRVETKDGNTVIVIYFDKITNDDVCLNIQGNRNVKLANLKPVPVTVYDYYDRTKKATVFYEPKKQNTCAICEGEDCGKSCSK